MSYPEDLTNDGNLQHLLFKKEFAQYKIIKTTSDRELNPSFLNEEILKENMLILHSHQLFTRNFINPSTPYIRLYVKHDPGTGKTILALSLAWPFIEYYSLQHRLTEEMGYSQTPMIYIIGFSKNIFQRELLKRPEFGFITRDEIKTYKRLKYLAETGTQTDKDTFGEFESRIRKRLSKKNRGGFFKFFGYKEFFNRLFIFSEEFVLNEETVLTEEAIYNGLKAGTIKLNWELIDAFDNSLIICDEIHNAYNSSEINNYGIAIQMILNIYDSPDIIDKITPLGPERIKVYKNSALRAVFMSATPLNNSPTEFIDLINLLIPLSQMNGKKSIKSDFFEDNRNLKPGALAKIQKMVQGYVSFLRDNNPKYFPEVIFKGETITIPKPLLSERLKTYTDKIIPYLKFIRCPMSKFHQYTYDKVYAGTLPPDGQSLMDMVLPNPGLIPDEPKDIGLFKTKDIKYSLQTASIDWLDKNHIKLEKIPNTNGVYITGEFMRLPELAKFSSKYAKLMHDMIDNLENDGGKVIIDHQYVKMSGVLFICEVLRKNGFIDEHASPTDDTLCSRCGVNRIKHKKDINQSNKKDMNQSNKNEQHEFTPARFIEYHGDIDKPTLDRSLEKFRSVENINGYHYRVLVGSKIINEGIDFNAVRNICVMVAPANIPTLVQILGRAVRKNSHIGLPQDKWNVSVFIYTSSLANNTQCLTEISSKVNLHLQCLSYEEQKYFDKSQDYLVIQQIEKIFNETAIDAIIHRDIIIPANYNKNKQELGMLYFEPSHIFGKHWLDINRGEKIKPRDLDLTTFRTFHSDEEIHQIIYIIKRAFIEQSQVWKYEELWDFCKSPPFEMHVNTELFLEDNFIIALHFLVRYMHDDNLIDAYQIMNYDDKSTLVNRLFDHLDRKIMIGDNIEYQIVYINANREVGYYILFPVNYEEIEADEGKIPASHLGVNSKNIAGLLDVDLESWCRTIQVNKTHSLHITKYLKTSNISYNQMKYKFYNQFKDTDTELMPTSTEIYELDFHAKLAEDCIKYAFNILTNPDMPTSELHEFYFKMLYFYNKLELILFADQIEEHKIFGHYKAYVTRADLKFIYGDKHKTVVIEEDHKYNPFLMSSILKSSTDLRFDINRLNDFIGKKLVNKHHVKLDDMKIEKIGVPKRIRKVFSNILPVGHFISSVMESTNITSIPKIYVPEMESDKAGPWVKIYDFMQLKDFKNTIENDIIVGYYEKNTTGIDVKFKLRLPIQLIKQHEDSRLIERGSACNTRKKEDLLALADRLGIKVNEDEYSIRNICNEIKVNLMTREMQSRKHADKHPNDKKLKWFYLHFEHQLESINISAGNTMEENQLNFAKELRSIEELVALKNKIINCIFKYLGDKKSINYFEKAFIRWIFNLNNSGDIKNFYVNNPRKFEELVLVEIDNYLKYEYIGIKINRRFIFNFHMITQVQKMLDETDDPIIKDASLMYININKMSDDKITVLTCDHKFFKNKPVSLPNSIYQRLTANYNGITADKIKDEKIYIMFMRYYELGGVNQHLSIPLHLVKKFDMELFGTPFNTVLNKFCSPFIDIDAEFGSRGNFFDYEWEADMLYTCNPPYDLDLMNAMSARILQQLDQVKCDVLVILPVWDPETQTLLKEKNYNIKFPAYDMLIKSTHLKSADVLLKSEATFYNYFTGKYINPSSVHLLVLSSMPEPKISAKIIKQEWIKEF